MRHPSLLLAVFLLAAPLLATGLPWPSAAQDSLRPVTSDSRIRTFVYSPNDVYGLTTHYGYQLNIEFGDKELVQTVSIGDRVGWQVVPAGQRLFLQAMRDGAHTNMTVVTNKRAYQFDLSSAARDTPAWDELVYVVRFYYPDDPLAARPPSTPPAEYPLVSGPSLAPQQPFAAQQPAPQPFATQPAMQPFAAPVLSPSVAPSPSGARAVSPASPASPSAPNYAYSFTGAARLVPRTVFDDGTRTYFLFDGALAANPPVVYAPLPGGGEQALPSGIENGYVAVYQVQPRLILRKGEDHLVLYNDRLEPPHGR